MFKKSIHWFRRDLRLVDNVSLSKASFESQEILPVFVFDINILNKLKDKDDKRVNFLYDSVEELKGEIAKLGGILVVLYGDPVEEIVKVAKAFEAQCVFTNKDYEPYARQRDLAVLAALKKEEIKFQSFKDQVVFEEEEILNQSAQPYKVFTPYKNAWLKKITLSDIEHHKVNLRKFIPKEKINIKHQNFSLKEIGFERTSVIFPSGRLGALKNLKQFTENIHNYHNDRNRIDFDKTSHLSIHLRFGTVSIRELFRFAFNVKGTGAETWKSELIWREFYQMILSQFPYVVKESFKKEFEKIIWGGKEAHFQAWCQGKTGFPIVDAAMRCFFQTGWMHNRLRMIVASFLTKDLLIDYKKGEAYFAQKLLDFDLAANNGGWQWSASTGCDAQPYFRVFNPFTQSKNFDPEGIFIKKYCPELANFSEKHIHTPHLAPQTEQAQVKCLVGKDYPLPIVDHDVQRKKAIEMFEAVR